MYLYRGISNVRQMINILNNWTAGGWKEDIGRTFNQVIYEIPNLEEIMVNQVGTGGEIFPKIVCYDDSPTIERSVIEYTMNRELAYGHGLVGLVTINIHPCYVYNNITTEKGVFCVSSAPVEIVNVILKRRDICLYLNMAYDYYINYKEPPMGMTNNKKVYDVCRCKRKIIR